MEAILYLEASIESEWLDSSWRSAQLPTAKVALAHATISSVALRLYALDDALSYVRVKRSNTNGGQPSQQAQAAAPSSMLPPSIAIDDVAEDVELSFSDPKQLPFVASLSAGAMALGTQLINELTEVTHEKTLNVVRRRKVRLTYWSMMSLNVK
ncbi:hypothetical protein PINS_up022381 [Pythium insidiosum]|nr:hypothetical protein PINS_up022381 [Pythium insidiosum]